MISTIAITICSCADDDDLGMQASSESICFGVSGTVAWPDEHQSQNRAGDNQQESRAGETPLDDMGCYAFMNSQGSLLINNLEYTRNASGIYTSSQVVFWPGSHTTLDFYNYSPYGATGLTFDPALGSPSFTYTLPENISDRCDLTIAVARNVRGDLNGAQPLLFRHALTQVKITIGTYIDKESLKITFSGLHGSGNITFADDGSPLWTMPDGIRNKDYTVAVYDSNYLIPQTLDGATMKIEMTADGKTITATVPLKTEAVPQWEPGKIVNYTINISPSHKFELIPDVTEIDAHYVMFDATLKVKSLEPDDKWELTVSADDNADVSVQHYTDVNEFAKDNFWTDKKIEINNGNNTGSVSARGTNSITGGGNSDFRIRIFAPENISGNNRKITLTAKLNGIEVAFSEITQLSPKGEFGWEQIDDNLDGLWGFIYNTRHIYLLNRNYLTSLVRNLMEYYTMYTVDSYNAGNYVSLVPFSKRRSSAFGDIYSDYCLYVDIDYEKLNKLTDLDISPIYGLSNTKNLFDHGGSGVDLSFETALSTMSMWGTNMYRQRNQTTDNDQYYIEPLSDMGYIPENNDGQYISDSQALLLILKKNKYNIYKETETVNGEDITTEAPKISLDDIVWYMPAKDQFDSFEAWTKTDGSIGHAAAEIWSSTGIIDDTNDKAFLGSGSDLRTAKHFVRACRYGGAP